MSKSALAAAKLGAPCAMLRTSCPGQVQSLHPPRHPDCLFRTPSRGGAEARSTSLAGCQLPRTGRSPRLQAFGRAPLGLSTSKALERRCQRVAVRSSLKLHIVIFSLSRWTVKMERMRAIAAILMDRLAWSRASLTCCLRSSPAIQKDRVVVCCFDVLQIALHSYLPSGALVSPSLSTWRRKESSLRSEQTSCCVTVKAAQGHLFGSGGCPAFGRV